MSKKTYPPPELWGGIECSINRVKDRYSDQLELNNYYKNNYTQNIIDLGIKKLRFPVLWEKHQPLKNGSIDFTWARGELNKMRAAGVEPIAGLVHHGSGPQYTNLSDANFSTMLAAYAGKVAAAFPWLKYYTPVNEPLTTARFSGLYGTWYPHKRNDAAFMKMLLIQLKGVVLSMQAIRQVNPAAVLVQTEDLSKTYSTPLLSYQAKFENHRRWLTFDILCGRLNEQHPLWKYCMRLGIKNDELEFFIKNPCPPGILGVNYYVTSERYLDENTAAYPTHSHGGNGIHSYADIEAVRKEGLQNFGPRTLIKELWDRFQLPIAITEVHLHCSREEQLRWFKFMYDTTIELVKEKVDIRAITAWALVGSYGWSSLLTGDHFEYETGAFDVSAGTPRLTALGKYLQNFVKDKEFFSDLTEMPGWWQVNTGPPAGSSGCFTPREKKPILILGKNGTLGKAFARECKLRNLPYFLLGREELDVRGEGVSSILNYYKPWAVINATGYVDVDKAEENARECEMVNSFGALNLALACDALGIKLLCFSSDLVFDGAKTSPYTEIDLPGPLNVYGRTKLLAEKFTTAVSDEALVIRTSAFFGPWDRYNFISTSLTRLLSDETVSAAADQVVSPTYVPHLTNASLNLLIDGESGIWHLANKGQLSWYELAVKVAAHYHIEPSNVEPLFQRLQNAERPAFSALSSTKYTLMPTLEQALDEYYYHKAGALLTP